MHATEARFELAFSSYGSVGWLPELGAWAAGVRRILEPGGRFVYVEFHPVRWSIGADLGLTGDDYFATAPFLDPVRDYVADSGTHLGAVEPARAGRIRSPRPRIHTGSGRSSCALLRAGLELETLREYPHANGCKTHPSLVAAEGRRWIWPAAWRARHSCSRSPRGAPSLRGALALASRSSRARLRSMPPQR